MSYIITFFLIGLIIFVHELGHFIMAKVSNIPVEIFSVGFGPSIRSVHYKGTEYRISIFPVGGYVLPKIENEDEFFKIAVHKRILMTLGGPVANLILPLFGFAFFNILSGGFSLENIFILPFYQTGSCFVKIINVIPSLFSHSEQLTSVVGVVAQGGKFISSNTGNHYFIISYMANSFLFASLFSINLAVLNLLPFPVLDGGKVFLYIFEKVHPKCLKLHFPLSVAGWIVLMGLMLYTTVIDIGKYIIGIFV